MAQVRLEALTKRFKQTDVLKGVDLTIEDGELFTLAGPSGCGKSTLLNLIAGLETPTSGRIYLDHQPVNALSPGERDVAFVFQTYALYPHMTVFENIAFPLRVKKTAEAVVQTTVRDTAALLGLEELLARRPKELSGGQRQRVALGRAIVRRPKVFLLDEPLSNLDALLRVEMRSELKRLHQELRATMIYVTHDQAEAMILSDRIAVMEGGTIQQCGTPQEVYGRPANRFVAGFLGSPSMNMVECRLRRGTPDRLEIGEATLPVPEAMQVHIPERAYQGPCLLGIRPQDVVVSHQSLQGGLEATVQVVEPMGSETWVALTIGPPTHPGPSTHPGTWRLRGRATAAFMAHPGDRAWVQADPTKIHLFDVASGVRLCSFQPPSDT